jgi:hypothetical protein
MRLLPKSRVALAAGLASLVVLLVIPSIAGANPGTGPDLVRRSGQFTILHADMLDGSSTREPMLVDGDRQTPVHAPGDVWIEPGSRVRLEGTMQNGALVLADNLTAVSELAPARLAGGLGQAPSTETTAVVQFYFAGQTTGLPTDPADTMTTNVKSLQAYYLEQTYDQITFQTTVFAPVTLSVPPPSSCPNSVLEDWAAKAEAAQAPGFDQAHYKHLVYVFPATPACGWSGIAYMPGRHVWINGSFTVPVIAHELGHNLGVAHAGGLTCTSSGALVPMGDACSIDRTHYALPQYADPFDAMGNQPVLRQMSMQHKLALGLLPATAVTTVSDSGTYQLTPMEEKPAGSTQLLRVPKPAGGSYFVEYRQPLGVFAGQAGSPTAIGVLIRTESPDLSSPNPGIQGDSDTALVDMHPTAGNPANQWWNAAMNAGEVFDDPLRGIVIQSVAQDAAGATLLITMPLDTVPPGSPGRLSAVLSGTTVALQWMAASDDREVASYVVARDGAALGTTGALTFTDGGAPGGATVLYTVSAVDVAGNVGPAASVSVAIPDTVAPGAPANVTARVTRDGTVHVAWGAATDNRGVTSYRILRNGTGVGQVAATSFVDKTPRPGNGATVTYSVVAFDLVGNAGPPGAARPLRAALLRKLGVSHVKVVRVKRTVRVKGTLSDAKATCRLHIGKGAWRPCKAKASGAFSVVLPAGGTKPVTLSLRDSLGRRKLLTLRVR